MAEVAFRYSGTTSLIHRFDPRIKLVGMIALSVLGAGRGWWGMVALFPAVALALVVTRISAKRLADELKAFLLFFIVLILVAAIKVDRNAQSSSTLIFSITGLFHGLLTVSRMAFIILAAALFTSTTTVREIRDAVWWFIRPFRFLPAGRIATMFSLAIRFIPLVFEEAASIRRAQYSRGAAGNRRPLRRLSILGLPLIVRTLRRVESVVRAMESRCYNDACVAPNLHVRKIDFLAGLAIGGTIAGSILLDRLFG